ncbi:class I SAM-dependent methyltransferase [Zhongshania guokunii]|uniref:Class I SAM-dependent methyltransferase n=1 Tax=Zhongshania guokunii TaxID=641783 RepID=A0ABV3U6M6_9GAMM
MVDAIAAEEKAKYQKMWGCESYRERSPGMRHLTDALARLKPMPGASVVDLGCGTGRVSAALQGMGFNVTAVDIAHNACSEFDGRFVASCLWELPVDLGRFEYGFCADVLEHVPTDRIPLTLQKISEHVELVYFQIANFVCHEGDKIGEHLHLTVKPLAWWAEELQQYFNVIEAVANPKHHVFVCKSLAF